MNRFLAILLSLMLVLGCMTLPAMAEEADADVVIVGAGGAGLSAAIEAVESGAEKVIVLEMTAKTGGALNYTSGSMSAAGTIIQKEDGIEDSVDSYVADILKNGSDFGGQPSEAHVRTYAENAAEVFDWLYENGVKDCTFSTDSEGRRAVFAPEHALYSIPRTYKATPQDREHYKSAAHEVLDKLVAANDKIEIVFNTKATELKANDKGQVLTVVAEGPDGEVSYTAKRGVIVCTGGYSSNSKLMGEYTQYGSYYLAGGAPASDGNALPMLQKVGAGITAMDAIPTFPMGLVSKDDPTRGQIASTYTWKTGGIVVNQEGERFCNETEANPAIREVALEEQTNAVQYDIYTDKILEDLAAAGGDIFMRFYFYEGGIGEHVMYSADSIEGLAEEIGVPAENLKATIEKYNEAVEKGEPDEFGREFNVSNTYNVATNKIEGDKYYAIRLHALCVMTLGGVTTNTDMQVLDESGNVIPGLYAAGEVVGGIWGKFVSGGTGVMGPIVFGKLAARHAMSNEPAEGYEVKASENVLDASLFEKETAETGVLFDMSRALTDGEYTATVDGQEGDLTVKVVIADGKMASIEILENHETPTVAAVALETIPQAILAANDVNVDVVATSTLTSNRIMNAVALCLEQAAQ